MARCVFDDNEIALVWARPESSAGGSVITRTVQESHGISSSFHNFSVEELNEGRK